MPWLRPVGAGSVNTKVLPFPRSLSTQIRPPCSSTRRFDSANPRPVPSRLLLARVSLLELLEDPVLVLRGDARPGIADRNAHLAIALRRADIDRPARPA